MAGRISCAAAFVLLLARLAPGQYTVRTIAGGGLPDAVPATSVDVGVTNVTLDGVGNVYILLAEHAILKLSPSGLLTRIAGNGVRGLVYQGNIFSPLQGNVLGNGCQTGPATGIPSLYSTILADGNGRIYAGGESLTCLHIIEDGVVKAAPGSVGGIFNFRVRAAAFDPAGNLYVAEGNSIKKYSGGAFTTVAGGIDSFNGQHFNGETGAATKIIISVPAGIAIDAAGNLYIADTGNHRIRKVSDGVMTTIAGSLPGFSGDDGPAEKAQLNSPSALALDAAGALYIADTGNHRIRKLANGIITTAAGTGVAGFNCDDCSGARAQLNTPTGLALDSARRLYIADSGNRRLRRLSGGVITTVAGGGLDVGDNRTPAGALFSNPTGLAVASDGVLYIADTGHNRVRRLAKGTVTTVAGGFGAGYAGDNGPANSAQLNGPTAVAIDRGGNLLIADTGNHRVRRITSAGIITTVAGTGVAGFDGDGGPAVEAKLNSPAGVAVDDSGNIYVADRDNNRVRRISGGIITTYGPAIPRTSGISGPGSGFFAPTGIAVDSAGAVYVQSNTFRNDITKIVNGADAGPVYDGAFCMAAFALDSGGTPIVTGCNRIKAASQLIGGDGHLGYYGDNVPALDAWFVGPAGVAVNNEGVIYVADNDRIRTLSPPSVRPKMDAGGVVNAASNQPALAPGALATLYGADFTQPIAAINNLTGFSVPHGVAYIGLCPGCSTYWRPAYNFVVPQSHDLFLTGGSLLATFEGGTNSVTLSLHADSGGRPGAVLESFALVDTLYPGWSVTSFSSSLHPKLAAGRQYWLSASIANPSTSKAYWWAPSTADPGLLSTSVDGGPWQPAEKADRAAFAIYGFPSAPGLPLPRALGGVTVSVGANEAPILYASDTQVNFQVPYETPPGNTILTLRNPAGTTAAPLAIAAAAPGISTYGSNLAVILNQDGSINSPAKPAKLGAIVTVFGTGAGPAAPPVGTGSAAPSSPLSIVPELSATINGVPAKVVFAGLTPGSVGLLQVNLEVPALPSGSYPIQVAVGTARSNAPLIAVEK